MDEEGKLGTSRHTNSSDPKRVQNRFFDRKRQLNGPHHKRDSSAKDTAPATSFAVLPKKSKSQSILLPNK